MTGILQLIEEVRNFFGTKKWSKLSAEIRKAIYLSTLLGNMTKEAFCLCIQDYTWTIYGSAKLYFKKGKIYYLKDYNKKYHIKFEYLKSKVFNNKDYFILFNKNKH